MTDEPRKVEHLDWGIEFGGAISAFSSKRDDAGRPCIWRISNDQRNVFTLQDSDEDISPVDSRYRTLISAMEHAALLEDAIKNGK